MVSFPLTLTSDKAVAGVNGQLKFDERYFSNPRIEKGGATSAFVVLGNEVDSPAKGCKRSVRLTQTEDLTLRNNIFILSGVVDETMLYQISGVGTAVIRFDHRDNTFFNSGHEVPVGGLADPNREPGFSKTDPQLAGGQGTDYATWLATTKLKSNSPSRGRGRPGAGK